MPRLFVRQNFDLGDRGETVEAGANQFGGIRSRDRVVLTVGKFSVGDVFDTNRYAHDPRIDFFNWAAIDAGTFDYAADAWGYSVGAAVEWYQGDWTLRGGVFDMSDVPNSANLTAGFDQFQTILEVERRYSAGSLPGRLALTVFQSHARMGLLDEAVQLAESTGTAVNIAAVRSYRTRTGASLNLEQQLAPDLGLFARLGHAGGDVEVYEFTDMDRSLSVGLSMQGTRWHRAEDTVGLAAIDSDISAARVRYLNAGGLGLLVGDGRLPHPGPEQIIETYYSLALLGFAHLSFDYQWIGHPAYNRDRGPVSVVAVRLHAQF
jgi:high affinity Mn2+ porin